MAENIAPRLFEFNGGGSDKFWIIELNSKSHTVRYGRQGTDGQTKTKDFGSEEEARKSYDKLVGQKTKKGYVEAASADESRGAQLKATQADLKEQEPFLAEIRDNPDDLGTYAVFADWLEEKGDPRGEFMNIQLQLEDESLKAADRKKRQTREAELLKEHEREWLGDLAPFLLDKNKSQIDYRAGNLYEYRFARGFMESLTVHYLLPEFSKVLKKSPHTGMLRELRLRVIPCGEELVEELEEQYGDKEWDDDDSPSFDALGGAEFPNLRHFEIDEDDEPSREYPSCHIRAAGVGRLLKKMPRLETLILEAHEVDTEAVFKTKMPHLKSLTVNHMDNYPIDVLAKNKSLTNLESIWFYPHGLDYDDEPYIQLDDVKAICRSKNLTSLKHLALYASTSGNEGIAELIDSGMLGRLKTLDMRWGAVTDEGAERLAAADLSGLESLTLSQNYMTAAGVKALKGTGVTLSAGEQNDGAPSDDDAEYLFMGDPE
ncbi:MAG: WGR domain-containing protein [Planctomycetes bacterium]|nr:WGR domain-containing protein [Planctomycetota bacterium]